MGNTKNNYDLALQIAVNKMVESTWENSALVLLDIRPFGQVDYQTICLDH